MLAIDVSGLTKRFDDVTAVDDLEMQVPRGICAGLLGGNGAGKTTTISMLMGLMIPTSGSVKMLGHDMATDRYAALARMNFQSPYVDLPYRLTVRENLSVYARLYGVSKVSAALDWVAELLDLGQIMKRRTGQLSAGQKTRVALAKALVNKPELLALDEPTASLDPDTADWVRSMLERYMSDTGATILLASHNMAEVERLCSTVFMMKQGEKVDEDSPKNLINRYGRQNLEEVFLDIARAPAEAA
ncbi:MAG: ABC transporter ATP-binding protein [Alphaproteobacteria bacterium]